MTHNYIASIIIVTDWFRFIGLCGSAMIQGLAELSQPVALLEWILLLPIGGTLDLMILLVFTL